MKKKTYKVDSFKTTFDTRKRFDRKLEEFLNAYADQGWQLEGLTTPVGEWCSVILSKEEE